MSFDSKIAALEQFNVGTSVPSFSQVFLVALGEEDLIRQLGSEFILSVIDILQAQVKSFVEISRDDIDGSDFKASLRALRDPLSQNFPESAILCLRKILEVATSPSVNTKNLKLAAAILKQSGITFEKLSEFTRQASDLQIYSPLGYGINLTEQAAGGGAAECPYVGGEEFMITLANQLAYTSTCIIGEPGVGKTAVVQGLAWHVARRSKFLRRGCLDWKIIAISRADLLAGTAKQGDLENRLKILLTHLRQCPHVIPFFDEVHMLFDARDEAGGKIANILKPDMASGRFRCIAATTDLEYERHIMLDEPLHSRLSPALVIPEPTEQDAVCIIHRSLPSLMPKDAGELGLQVADEAVGKAVALTQKYQRQDRLPRKAIRFLTGALRQKCERLEKVPGEPTVVDAAFIVNMARRTYGPTVNQEEPGFWSGLQGQLGRHLPNQWPASTSIAAFLSRSSQSLVPNRTPETPMARFLLLENEETRAFSQALVQVLSRQLFGDVNASESEDCREFSDPMSRTRLVGSPPGYVGHSESRTIFSKIRSRPLGGVLMLKNLDRAHPSLHPDFIALLAGTSKTASGQRIDLSRWIILLTTSSEAPLPPKTPMAEWRRHLARSGWEPAILRELDWAGAWQPATALNTTSVAAVIHSLPFSVESSPEEIESLEKYAKETGLPPDEVVADWLQKSVEISLFQQN